MEDWLRLIYSLVFLYILLLQLCGSKLISTNDRKHVKGILCLFFKLHEKLLKFTWSRRELEEPTNIERKKKWFWKLTFPNPETCYTVPVIKRKYAVIDVNQLKRYEIPKVSLVMWVSISTKMEVHQGYVNNHHRGLSLFLKGHYRILHSSPEY